MSKSIQASSGFVSNTQLNPKTQRTSIPQDKGLRKAIIDTYDIKPGAIAYNIGKCVAEPGIVNCTEALISTMGPLEIGERIQVMNDPYIQHMPKDDVNKAIRYGIRHNLPQYRHNHQIRFLT